MKKIILLAALSSFFLFGCNNGDNNRKDYPTVGEAQVSDMINQYKVLVKENVNNVIQQIVVDQKQLRKFIQGSERVKLIAAGYETPIPSDEGPISTTIIIQIMTRKDTTPVYTYYDFRKVFKPTAAKPGAAAGGSTICPPPDDCGIPFIKQ